MMMIQVHHQESLRMTTDLRYLLRERLRMATDLRYLLRRSLKMVADLRVATEEDWESKWD